MQKISLITFLVITLGFISCNPEKEETKPETSSSATVRLKLEHTFNGEPLNFDSKLVTENNDTIQISELKYFLSNLTFMEGEDTHLAVNDSYYLVDVDESNNITEIDIPNLKEGVYDAFSLSLGVDSTHNHSITNATGDLDPNGADQMIWSWNTGYKFVKFEGEYMAEDTTGTFIFHIGGDANYKTFVFGENSDSEHNNHEEHSAARLTEGDLHISLENDKTTEIHLVIDIAEIFVSPNVIDLKTTNKAHGDAASLLMDNIYMNMDESKNGWFELHHIMQF